MEVLITSSVKALLGKKYNSYIHAARNAKVTSTRDVYIRKLYWNGKTKVFRGVFRTHSNIYDKDFLRKKLTG